MQELMYAIKHPTPVERLYHDILSRLAARGQVKKPEGGFEDYLKEHFCPKSGDAYSVAVNLRNIGKLQHEESSLLIDFFGLKFNSSSTKAQIAKRHGVSVSAINRQIVAAEEKLIENSDMVSWLKDFHPEAWPA